MPNNVTAIRSDKITQEIDVREEQQMLLDAEDACLSMLEACSKANLGFVSFIRKMNYSNVHPKTRQLMDRSEKAMGHVFGLFATFNESHKIAHGMATGHPDLTVVMSGGISKDEKGLEPGADGAEYLREVTR